MKTKNKNNLLPVVGLTAFGLMAIPMTGCACSDPSQPKGEESIVAPTNTIFASGINDVDGINKTYKLRLSGFVLNNISDCSEIEVTGKLSPDSNSDPINVTGQIFKNGQTWDVVLECPWDDMILLSPNEGLTRKVLDLQIKHNGKVLLSNQDDYEFRITPHLILLKEDTTRDDAWECEINQVSEGGSLVATFQFINTDITEKTDFQNFWTSTLVRNERTFTDEATQGKYSSIFYGGFSMDQQDYSIAHYSTNILYQFRVDQIKGDHDVIKRVVITTPAPFYVTLFDSASTFAYHVHGQAE